MSKSQANSKAIKSKLTVHHWYSQQVTWPSYNSIQTFLFWACNATHGNRQQQHLSPKYSLSTIMEQSRRTWVSFENQSSSLLNFYFKWLICFSHYESLNSSVTSKPKTRSREIFKEQMLMVQSCLLLCSKFTKSLGKSSSETLHS